MKTVWMVVADRGHAQIFKCDPHRQRITPMESHRLANDNLRNPEVVSETVGVVEPPDGHADPAVLFSRELVEYLEQKFNEDAFEGLILIAPAAVLGALTARFSAGLAAAVAARHDDDLSRIAPHAVLETLAEILGRTDL